MGWKIEESEARFEVRYRPRFAPLLSLALFATAAGIATWQLIALVRDGESASWSVFAVGVAAAAFAALFFVVGSETSRFSFDKAHGRFSWRRRRPGRRARGELPFGALTEIFREQDEAWSWRWGVKTMDEEIAFSDDHDPSKHAQRSPERLQAWLRRAGYTLPLTACRPNRNRGTTA